MAKLTKSELIETYLEEFPEAKKSEVDKTIKNFTEFIHVIYSVMEEGDSFTIPELGTFSLGKLNAREGKNPQTGEPMQIAETFVARFKPAKALKDLINE